MHGASRQSHKQTVACNQQCSMNLSVNPVGINNVRPLAGTMLTVMQIQPFIVASTTSNALPLRQSSASPPPTLLSLSCALTI
jgi:hypothetical protein